MHINFGLATFVFVYCSLCSCDILSIEWTSIIYANKTILFCSVAVGQEFKPCVGIKIFSDKQKETQTRTAESNIPTIRNSQFRNWRGWVRELVFTISAI